MQVIYTPIEYRLIPMEERLEVLLRYFGYRASVFQNSVFETFQTLCPEYRGGYWHFYEALNGAFFMAPARGESFTISVAGNGFQGAMSAHAAGVTVCLFVQAAMAARFEDEDIMEMYESLRDHALGHEESALIMSAID